MKFYTWLLIFIEIPHFTINLPFAQRLKEQSIKSFLLFLLHMAIVCRMWKRIPTMYLLNDKSSFVFFSDPSNHHSIFCMYNFHILDASLKGIKHYFSLCDWLIFYLAVCTNLGPWKQFLFVFKIYIQHFF